MIAVDSGLLALAVNRHAPGHAQAARLIEDLANGDRPWAVAWPALYELIARLTHRHAVARPLAAAEAAAWVERLIESPSLRVLGPTPRHARVLSEVLADLEPGPAPPGLDSAVVLREHGVRELLGTDRGMRRFGFLTVIDPLRGEGWSPVRPPARRYRRLGAGG